VPLQQVTPGRSARCAARWVDPRMSVNSTIASNRRVASRRGCTPPADCSRMATEARACRFGRRSDT
jgi:hypothetical protein